MLKLNGLEKEDYIYPEQNIIIPNMRYQFYITQPNDTLTTISENLNKEINELLQTNENIMVEPDQIIIYK